MPIYPFKCYILGLYVEGEKVGPWLLVTAAAAHMRCKTTFDAKG